MIDRFLDKFSVRTRNVFVYGMSVVFTVQALILLYLLMEIVI